MAILSANAHTAFRTVLRVAGITGHNLKRLR